jgi:hypothetical protein
MEEFYVNLKRLQSWRAGRIAGTFMTNCLTYHRLEEDEVLKDLCHKLSKLEFEKVMDVYQIIEETVKRDSKLGYYEESEYKKMLEYFKENVLDKKELPFSLD